MSEIKRSTGTPLADGVSVAGGGFRGLTPELDAVVAAAAVALAEAYGTDIEIRFNSDRESGGAWIKTAVGRYSSVGICASLVTARIRQLWERHAVEDETMARTGVCSWGGPARPSQRKGARDSAKGWRAALAACPEGQLTILAHIERSAVRGEELQRELAQLDGWNSMGTLGHQAYHHGPAETVAAALERCLHFAPLDAVL